MNKPDTFTINLPAPLLFSLALLTAAIQFKLFNQLYADYDLWWHIFIGTEILENGALASTDIYSFTAFGQPYINHEWASEIIMAAAFLKLGDIGLIIWRWSLAILIIAIAYQIVRRQTAFAWTRIFVLLCFTVVIAPGISFRVHLFSYAFLLILLEMIDVFDKKAPVISLSCITLLFVLWANLHGAFVLGLVVWFIYLFDFLLSHRFRGKVLLGLFAAVLPVAATLLSPYGFGLWGFIYNELSNPLSAKYISEWQHFSFSAREMPFFIVMVLAWTSFFVSGIKKGFAESIILLIATLMGLLAVRNTPLFVVLSLPAMGRHIEGAFFKLVKKARQGRQLSAVPIYICTTIFIGLSVVFILLGLPKQWKILIGKDPIPVQSVAFLKENAFKGKVWVPLHFGGYVLFHLYPDMRVSIDGRWAMVYPRSTMKDCMDFSYQGTRGKWKEILDKYHADYALVEAGNSAIPEMSRDPDWGWGIVESCCGLLMRKALLADPKLSITVPEKKPIAWP